jgi:hypothetical protein
MTSIDFEDVGLDQKFIDKIKFTLNKILTLIKLVGYDESGDNKTGVEKLFEKMTRSYRRVMKPSFYANELLRELTILNSYFIYYI